MAKKTKPSPPPQAAAAPEPAPRKIGALTALLWSSFGAALLALYQWMELLVANAGGDLACSINASLDCAPVWSSSFAKAIGGATGIPIAAWGLVWALAAFACAFGAWLAALNRPGDPRTTNAARVVALAGIFAVITLFTVSLGVGVLCPTCLLTYALTITYAIAAFRLPGPMVPAGGELVRGGLTALGLVFAAYLALLLATRGSPTSPDRPATPLTTSRDAGSAPLSPAVRGPLADYLATLDRRSLQMLSDQLHHHKSSPPIPAVAPRFRSGAATAPLQMVEWTDIKCGHCAHFVATMKEMKPSIDGGGLAIEPRQFPLDSECNPDVPQTDGAGTRCMGARTLICLEGSDAFFRAQEKMFEEQEKLTKDRVLEIARSFAPDKAALDRCIGSPETEAKLREDIRYAVSSHIEGTPQVVLNGRHADPSPALVYALVLAAGDADHAAFSLLPPPRPRSH
jgi:uncharacterized membrane protein